MTVAPGGATGTRKLVVFFTQTVFVSFGGGTHLHRRGRDLTCLSSTRVHKKARTHRKCLSYITSSACTLAGKYIRWYRARQYHPSAEQFGRHCRVQLQGGRRAEQSFQSVIRLCPRDCSRSCPVAVQTAPRYTWRGAGAALPSSAHPQGLLVCPCMAISASCWPIGRASQMNTPKATMRRTPSLARRATLSVQASRSYITPHVHSNPH